MQLSASVSASVKEGRMAFNFANPLKRLAPQVGLEPTTLRLTAECSAIELLRSKTKLISFQKDSLKTNRDNT